VSAASCSSGACSATECPEPARTTVRLGMDIELEHGLHDPLTKVTGDEPTVTGKIALAHLKESLTTTRASRGWRQRRGGITRVEASRSPT
jgi:hypothetical protein